MGCTKIGHRHVWPTEGLLIIQRCEVRCNFCSGEAGKKSWKYAWFLRRHVRAIHVGKKGKGQHPNLIVDDSWDDSKLHHLELKKLLSGKKPSDIKYVEQPEFEEQRIGGVFHLSSSAFIKQEYDEDADMFNGGAREFYGNDDGTYPAFADDHAASSIQNPFEYDDIEGFLFNTVMGQMEYPDEPPIGLVEDGEPDDDDDQAISLDNYPNDAPAPLSVDESAKSLQFAPTEPGLVKDEPDWDAAPRFFMDDYKYDSAEEKGDELDDLPLAQVHYGARPSFDRLARMISMLESGTEQMMAQDATQPSDMLPALNMFARALIARNQDHESA